MPAGDDCRAWRTRAASLIRSVAGLDLNSPRVRVAVKTKVAGAAARRGAVVSAETFVANLREVTQRWLATTDLTAPHNRTMIIWDLRDARATWQQIVNRLDDAAVSLPGGRG
ncbi:MAG: hypothetical protein OXI95_20025 [bacterium]|nr:hypothetical protein [bacterium]